jgi:hypothetical protein
MVMTSDMRIENRASLIIGGTGMLWTASQWLASRSMKTVLVARHASSFARLEEGVMAVDADWNRRSFEKTLSTKLADASPIDRALLWIHDPDPVLSWLLPILSPARVVLILGSMDGKPEIPESAAHIATLRLGSFPTTQGRRWLTHEEISAAAIETLKDGKSRVVGELQSINF